MGINQNADDTSQPTVGHIHNVADINQTMVGHNAGVVDDNQTSVERTERLFAQPAYKEPSSDLSG